jgi:hypothetical protein
VILGFDNACRCEFGEEVSAVLVVSRAVFFREENCLAGQAVAETVEAGAGFAFVSARTCGVLDVLAVGCQFELRKCVPVMPSGCSPGIRDSS